MNTKNSDRTYNFKSIKTAVKHAIEDGVIVIGTDLEQSTLDGWVYEAEATGKFYEYWRSEESGQYFRFQIEQIDDSLIYIDIGYRIIDPETPLTA